MLKRKLLVNAILLSGLAGGFYSSAWAATTTLVEEPAAPAPSLSADDCASTTAITPALDAAIAVKGAVGATGDAQDFYKFTGVAGDLVKVTVAKRGASKVVPSLSVLGTDSDPASITGCAPLSSASNTYEVPSDGVVFVQLDTPGQAVNYTLTVTPVESIGSVTGKVIDATTKKPLSGFAKPYAAVALFACNDAGTQCNQNPVDYSDVDNKGVFSFDSSFGPLAVGNYKVVATASQYQAEESAILAVDADGTNAGTLALTPNPVSMSVKGCGVNSTSGNLPSTGGKCKVKVTLTNNSGAALKSSIWGIVEGNGIDTLGQTTEFPLGTQAFVLAKGASKAFDYTIDVPGDVDDSASINAHFYIGAGGFNVIANDNSFFLYKSGDADPFAVVPEDQQPQYHFHNFWDMVNGVK